MVLTANSGQTVCGVASVSCIAPTSIAQGQSGLFVSDGVSNWYLVASHGTDWGLSLTVNANLRVNGSIDVQGNFNPNATTTTGTTLTLSNSSMMVQYLNAASNNIAVSLTFNGNRIYFAKRTDTSTHAVVLTPSSGTIEGLASYSLQPGQSVLLSLTGTDYKIIASYEINANTSEFVAFSTASPSSGSAFTPTSVGDSVVYIPIAATTTGTVTITMGPSTGAEHTIVPSSNVAAASEPTFTLRVPAAWKVVVTITGTTVSIGTATIQTV
jgi:hypothetical protein